MKRHQHKKQRQKQRRVAKRIRRQKLTQRKQRIEQCLKRLPDDSSRPMLTSRKIHYELADRTKAIACGGIGMMHQLALQTGLVDAINRHVHVFKLHMPYHESDHVLNIAYNALCGGQCLEDIELRRNDEVFLDALGTPRIPDPTTAGDFCRRFQSPYCIENLQRAIDEARLNVWKRQPSSFFDKAIIDVDSHILGTTGNCKDGMDMAYDGTWGYHPLIVSLANTQEVLRIINRSGNRPSEEGAAKQINQVLALCRRAGFRQVVARGDTAFSQTEYLDGWDAEGLTFYFGYDAAPNLKKIAENLAESEWWPLERPPKYDVKTVPRRRPENVKDAIVVAREFETLRQVGEQVAEFDYKPTACRKKYRMVVVRKNISVEQGKRHLFDKIRYFFYITNDRDLAASEVVFQCNERCNQENLISQLSSGVRALRAPVDNLWSNGAYMVMTALAWNLKAWFALWLPERPGRWQQKHHAEKQRVLKMEFRTFVNAMMMIPCQIIRTSRRLVYRMLNWNPWQGVFFRLVDALDG